MEGFGWTGHVEAMRPGDDEGPSGKNVRQRDLVPAHRGGSFWRVRLLPTEGRGSFSRVRSKVSRTPEKVGDGRGRVGRVPAFVGRARGNIRGVPLPFRRCRGVAAWARGYSRRGRCLDGSPRFETWRAVRDRRGRWKEWGWRGVAAGDGRASVGAVLRSRPEVDGNAAGGQARSSWISSQDRLPARASSPVRVAATRSRFRCCKARIFSSTVPRAISL